MLTGTSHRHATSLVASLITALIMLTASPAWAGSCCALPAIFDEGRLLATGGVSQIEGAGGGGLGAWATITGYGTRDGIGVNAHLTYLNLPNYALWSPGVAIGLFDRLELSYARQSFDTEADGAALGLGRGFTFHQSIFGAKLRLLGNIVYDQNTLLPQLAVGVQFKNADRGAVLSAIGAKASSGTDFYLAASKLILSQNLLLNLTLRATKANQFGLLGFGGNRNANYAMELEGGLAYLLSRRLAVGGEVRTKPDNLRIAHEGSAYDLFAAYFLNKNLSFTLAYVSLGNIVNRNHQDGVYLSVQGGF